MKTIDELLETLDNWLKQHRIDFYRQLNPGATDREIEHFQQTLDLQLSKEFMAFYKWKNGQPMEILTSFHPLTNEMFMSLQTILTTYQEQKELLFYGDIQPGTWSNTWIPFMDDGNSNYTCINLDRTQTGAILYRNHELGEATIIYQNFEEWLSALITELQTNNFDNWDFEEC